MNNFLLFMNAPLAHPSYATESTNELTKGCRDAEDTVKIDTSRKINLYI